jgi:hypothetical protein
MCTAVALERRVRAYPEKTLLMRPILAGLAVHFKKRRCMYTYILPKGGGGAILKHLPDPFRPTRKAQVRA